MTRRCAGRSPTDQARSAAPRRSAGWSRGRLQPVQAVRSGGKRARESGAVAPTGHPSRPYGRRDPRGRRPVRAPPGGPGGKSARCYTSPSPPPGPGRFRVGAAGAPVSAILPYAPRGPIHHRAAGRNCAGFVRSRTAGTRAGIRGCPYTRQIPRTPYRPPHGQSSTGDGTHRAGFSGFDVHRPMRRRHRGRLTAAHGRE